MDFIIKNATVFDGVSIEPQRLTVGVEGERIVHVGDELTNSAAKRVIDGTGLFLCPGFIDTHASTGFGYMRPHAADHKLFQGVTTEIIGNCGVSSAPIGDLFVSEMEKLGEQIGFDFSWRTMGEWFAQVEAYGLPFNFGTYAGHNTMRAGACKNYSDIQPEELDQLGAMVETAMRDGVLGMTTGLVYAPGSFADTAEVIRLAKIVAKHGGMYASHIRNEREALLEAVAEAIEIGRAANLPVLVSHLKAGEKPYWGDVPKAIRLIEEARERGQQVTFEVYPYAAASTKLSTFVPKDAIQHGFDALPDLLRQDEWRKKCVDWFLNRQTGFETMWMVTDSIPGAQGKTILELAREQNREPADLAVDILIADPMAWIVYKCMSDDDVDAAVMWENSNICSDSWSYPVNAETTIGHPHPRTFGAFSRFLERWALREEKIPFGHAVRKITSIPANFLRLTGRGKIQEGHYADLVLLDPENVQEKATIANPRQFSEGTEYVWVNGTLMLEKGDLYTHKPGHLLRRK